MRNKSKGPKEYLFVDGYNIINSWDILKDLSLEQLEEARDKLIEIMAEYQHYSGINIIIVFDAHLVKGNSGTEENHMGLKVIYTKESETADHYIEKSLHEIGRVKRVRVATSDWMEQQIILGRGGTRISARELEMEVFGQKKLIRSKRVTENQKNNFMLGQLDEETIMKLNNWNNKE
jgi:predicted RNA-binding protein with PIN domain